MYLELLLLFIVLNPLGSTMNNNSDNQLLFTSIGETTRESGYAHLVIPLPIPRLKDTINVLKDLIQSHNEVSLSEANVYRHTESYGIDRLQEKIGLILSLAQKNGFVATELHWDDVNKIKEGLQHLSSRKRRSLVAATAGLLGLASFGTSIFNQAQISRLNDDRQQQIADRQFLMEELEEQSLRIDNVTRFVNKQYDSWVKQVNHLVTGQQKTIMREMDHYIHLLIQAFRMEMTDFLSGITRLMENRLSPLLVKAKDLNKAFSKLTGLARTKNMRPLSDDAGILFQVSTSTIVDNQGNLFAIVHLPLYAGNTLKLYRYVPAPFFLDDSQVVVEIHSRTEYLALDTHGMMGRQMTASEFQLCRKTGAMYHCPNMNLLSKKLQTLCLYNLFSQASDQIELTCDVRVSLIKSHAVQISNSLYRILSTNPIQLVKDCKLGNNITTVHGVYLLRLTEECPKASTPDHLFVRTPDLVGYHELITLPLLTQSRKWLGEVAKELDHDFVMQSLKEVAAERPTIPLRQFRNHLQRGRLATYRVAESYITSVVVYGVLIVLLFIIVIFISRYLRNRCSTNHEINRANTYVRANREELDGALIGRPNISMPSNVRRQFATK